MWAANRYAPVLHVIPVPWSRIGYVVMALAPITPIAAVVRFRRARTTVDPHRPEEASVLVTSGVYGWTRNPMYLGLAILLVGWAIALGALTAFAGPALLVPLLERVQIRAEEHALRMRFGEPYERYCRRVHRWIGRSRAA